MKFVISKIYICVYITDACKYNLEKVIVNNYYKLLLILLLKLTGKSDTN